MKEWSSEGASFRPWPHRSCVLEDVEVREQALDVIGRRVPRKEQTHIQAAVAVIRLKQLQVLLVQRVRALQQNKATQARKDKKKNQPKQTKEK